MVLKLDLVKAFEKVNWSFHRMVLLQIGIPGTFVNWIVGCVDSSNFVVLINGTPYNFFPVSRGIRQGCPISPLLFILIIESLSLLITNAQGRGVISGIKVSPSLNLPHLLFVDDVILFGMGTVEEWKNYKEILDTFCSATGMEISVAKSSFLFNDIDETVRQRISNFLPFKMDPLTLGFKYLGYYLKPLGYGIKDWRWFIQKFQKNLSNWTYKLLSLGGRLVLVKYVLMGLAVYWLSLARMPNTILTYIGRYIFNFLWGSTAGNHKYHLVD